MSAEAQTWRGFAGGIGAAGGAEVVPKPRKAENPGNPREARILAGCLA